jgi:hypothetical protein
VDKESASNTSILQQSDSTFTLLFTMKETFELTLANTTYTLQREDHPELFPFYNVCFSHGEQLLRFSMECRGGRWVRRPQSLPWYVNDHCVDLADAIAENEAVVEKA